MKMSHPVGQSQLPLPLGAIIWVSVEDSVHQVWYPTIWPTEYATLAVPIVKDQATARKNQQATYQHLLF
jgi:hypothetical protein